jgi:hypothetical protein
VHFYSDHGISTIHDRIDAAERPQRLAAGKNRKAFDELTKSRAISGYSHRPGFNFSAARKDGA